DFNGPSDVRTKMETLLERCGWFSLSRGANARNAEIRLNVKVSAQGAIRADVHAGNKQFTASSGAEGWMAPREVVDGILKELFNVRSLCTRKLFFVVGGKDNKKEIYSSYLDGNGVKRETNNDAISTEPSWGHANAMVYTLAKNNALCIVLFDRANSRQRIVSNAPGLNSSAGLSHDGSMVALPMSVQNQVDLYYIDLKDNSRIRVTKDRNVESSPCWSPDDSRIVYVSDKLGVPQLYLKDLKTGTDKRISSGNNESVSPDWSNVSNKLCFSMKDNAGQRVICVIDMNDPTLQAKVVTRATGQWEAPSWGPDGRQIVCTRSSASAADSALYVVDSWTGAFMRVFDKSPKVTLPAWNPAY
ncbi:MAG: PD40 domain-containing protein, partial [Victivallales bacterium]|nr:PD40 domain-containing protein [Victivallales bacterium]